MKPRIALVSLPHVRLNTPTTHLCAYSKKCQSFLKMMKDRYDITVYAPECDPIPGVTMVDCLSDEWRQTTFGLDHPNRLPAWPTDQESSGFNAAVVGEIRGRAEPRDLILFSGGLTHAPIRNALPEFLCAEPFVGYEGVFGGNVHAAYESYSHMAQVAQKYGYNDIRWYDRVIQPFCDPDEFPSIGTGEGDYLLFIGRLIPRKGPHIALQIAEACDLPLVVAGSGGRMEGDALIGQDVCLRSSKVPIIYKGPVGIKDRAILMSEAVSVLCPTTYNEPGGNVAIETMMAGTSVIAPDWGVFAETVQHWKTGFHFRTLKQAVEGVRHAHKLDPQTIRDHAMTNYSLSAIGLKFDAWFSDLSALWRSGWNEM